MNSLVACLQLLQGRSEGSPFPVRDAVIKLLRHLAYSEQPFADAAGQMRERPISVRSVLVDRLGPLRGN